MRFLKLRDVIQMTGISKTTIYRLMDAGLFPAQYCIGEKIVRWKEEEVQAWMERQPMKKAV
ncbi:AlpA family transcriptional regulator [uncultured Thiothrix sp.]|jgi:prophage regulatory protein|uniref:helix-turn-helix transcriptional regulator n=1 Tax=uncultured Thiothrix sp. TaxID=223185 RepID=UPI00260CBDFB|nr:AlpA family phage regulatory protein [uncultured Thiothrix sp.]HMT94627.1 AlpA family phage regulatory protein [Thiolinea sp.]